MRFVCLVAVLFAWSVPGADAQERPLRVEWLTVRDGLPGTAIADITQDPAGYLWLGTFFGVARYDGHSFEYFRGVEGAPPQSTVLALADTGGEMLVATRDDGVYRFEYDSQKFLELEVPVNADGIADLGVDEDASLWLATWSNGLFRRTAGGAWTHYVHDPADPRSLSSNHIMYGGLDSRGRQWFGSSNGFNILDPAREGFTRILEDPGAPHTPPFRPEDLDNYPTASALTMLEMMDGSVWAGTGSGLVHLGPDGQVLRRLGLDDGLPDLWVHTLTRLDHATLLVSTREGPVLFDLEEERVRPLHWTDGGRPDLDRFVISAYRDHSDVLWLGTAGGLARTSLASDRFEQIPVPLESPMAIIEDLHGRLWVGGDDGVLALRESGGAFTAVWSVPGGFAIMGAAVGPDNRIAVTTAGAGVFEFLPPVPGSVVPELLAHHRRSTGLGGDNTRVVHYDPDGTLWVGDEWGLDRIDPSGRIASTRHDPDNSETLPAGYPTDLTRDQSGRLWLAFIGGMAVSENDGVSFRRYFPEDARSGSLAHPSNYTVDFQADGTAWIANYAGVDRLGVGSDSFEHFQMNPDGPLPSGVCLLVADDIWTTTFSGVGRIDPSTGTVTHYGVERGLDPVDFSTGTACHRAPSGRMYFSGRNRLYTIDPDDFRDNLTAPRISITSVSVNGLASPPAFWPAVDGSLRHFQNDIRVDFNGLHFEAPHTTTYAYRLLPLQNQWTNLGNSRSVALNLRPGSYQFEVTAMTARHVSSPAAVLAFSIADPWWKSGTFAVAMAVLLMIGSVGGYRWRTRHLKRRAELLHRIVRERTRELRAEKDRTEAQATRLADLDRAKSRFFANVSHEFRTPLTLILGPLQDLLDQRKHPDDLAREVPVMHRSARRLLRLINQVLDISKLEADAMPIMESPTELVSFLRGLVLAFGSHAEREHLSLLFRSSTPACPVDVDRDKLEKIVGNLVSNAINYTPRGGKVLVELGIEDDQSSCSIFVCDTGAGIPPESVDRVFDRFQRVDNRESARSHGVGIGLALAKELTELLGGSIGVTSRVGFGSEFVVRLPVRKRRESAPESLNAAEEYSGAAKEVHSAPDKGTVLTHQSVLIVEDDADMRDYLARTFRPGYEVRTAQDGEEGLRMAHADPPDLVVSDVMMPRLGGFGLCRALKGNAALESIPVILLTARADSESVLEGLDCQADDYLAKPFKAAELLARADNLLSSRRRLRERWQREVRLEPGNITVSSEDAAFLERILAVVEHHLGDSTFSIDWLADEVALSRRQLERKIHDITDATPAELVRRLRIARAEQLLRAKAGTVGEIAYMVGFRSPSHFARVFREITGQSPSKVRGSAVSET